MKLLGRPTAKLSTAKHACLAVKIAVQDKRYNTDEDKSSALWICCSLLLDDTLTKLVFKAPLHDVGNDGCAYVTRPLVLGECVRCFTFHKQMIKARISL